MGHDFPYSSGRENITVKPHLLYSQNYILGGMYIHA